MSTQTETGAILTCAHDQCGCMVTINQPCSCPGASGNQYTCACGAPMVPKEMPTSPL